MRVTAGEYKGRVLEKNVFEHIRPTADMVKQAMFNSLGDAVVDARVLDLCCGTGALGIEALSRGAREVVFVDKDYRSVKLTKQNLDKLKIRARVVKMDACQFVNGEEEGFDIILFDPPYKSEIYEEVFKLLAEGKCLKDDGILLSEQAKEDKLNYSPLNVLKEHVYGIKKVVTLTK